MTRESLEVSVTKQRRKAGKENFSGNDSLNNPELMELAFLDVYAHVSPWTRVYSGTVRLGLTLSREIWPLPSAPGRRPPNPWNVLPDNSVCLSGDPGPQQII